METTKNICKLCNKQCEESTERIYCQGPCQQKFHSKCVGFTPVSLKFYRSSDNLIFECDDCRDNPNRMLNVTLNKMLSFLCIFDERLKRQETNCDQIFKHFETINGNLQRCESEIKAEMNKATTVTEGTKTLPTYADIAKKLTVPVPVPVVLVKPKTKQKCSATRAMLDEKMIPKQFDIKSVSNLPNGGLEIQCKNGNDLSKLHDNAVKELSVDYEIIIPKMCNPKIRITNMSEKLNETQIIENIKKQNESIKDGHMKVLHVFNVKYNETYGAIVEVDAKSFDVLVKKKRVFIGTDICKVMESVSVLRCFKCCGYKHRADTCRNNKACLRCGGEHIIKDCKATKSVCINCKTLVEKRNLDINWTHSAWSRECTVLQRHLEREKLRTKYSVVS